MGIIQKIKRRGLLTLLGITFNRIVPEWIFRFAMMDVYELDVDSVSTTSTSNDLLVENVGQDERKREALRVATWNSVDRSELKKHTGYSARLQPAEIGQGETAQSPVAGGLWVAMGSYPETPVGFRLMFQPEQAWIYAAYVNPAIRGKNVYQRTLAFACTDLDRERGREILVAVAPWNKASVYVHKKHSKRTLGRITAIRFACFVAVFRTGTIQKSKTFSANYKSNPIKIGLHGSYKSMDKQSVKQEELQPSN